MFILPCHLSKRHYCRRATNFNLVCECVCMTETLIRFHTRLKTGDSSEAKNNPRPGNCELREPNILHREDIFGSRLGVAPVGRWAGGAGGCTLQCGSQGPPPPPTPLRPSFPSLSRKHFRTCKHAQAGFRILFFADDISLSGCVSGRVPVPAGARGGLGRGHVGTLKGFREGGVWFLGWRVVGGNRCRYTSWEEY